MAEYPPSRVDNLYILKDDLLEPVDTGCPRNPLPLISLSTHGETLWAVDRRRHFPLSGGRWALVDIDDLRNGVWPAET